MALGLAVCAVPLSIAVTESLLAIALALQIWSMLRQRRAPSVPGILWLWIPWAAFEIVSWLSSPEMGAGLGELRHLLLPLAVFLAMPALARAGDRVRVWRGLFFTATIGSAFVLCGFVYRLIHYRHELAIAPDPSLYLRAGGLLHHWMIYGTVEVMVFAGLLEFWRLYPEERRRLAPMIAINAAAIVVSLTRMLWICTLALLVLHLLRRRSKWIWATPALPMLLFIFAPVRARVVESLRPDYYSNLERVQMLRIGWEMISGHPWSGVGPGRVEKLYRSYLSAADPTPAYYGHLHNNAVQLAAQFGLPVLLAAVLFAAAIFTALRSRAAAARDRDEKFLCRASLMALIGFVMTGMFDYTYGHSLGLILLSFIVLSPLTEQNAAGRDDLLLAADRVLGALLLAALLPLVALSAIAVRCLSRRSPFVAHLRAGQDGRLFWMWKLRTMWPRNAPVLPAERGWVQRIDAEPSAVIKPPSDPRVTSRFAAFCRRYSIDELPQLLHVVRGEMSLVGPRPVTRGELAKYYGSKSKDILTVRPGLTGYWQISGRSRLSYAERVKCDLALVRGLSLRIYFLVLIKTIPQVLSGENAW